MSPYDEKSMPNEDISIDGLHFTYNKPFFLIGNKKLTGKMYFEVNVSNYYPISAFHNIPIYIGVSREASFGVLNADFCIGALYHEYDKNFDIQEKFNAVAINNHVSPEKTLTHLPGGKDVIGVGVDVPGNKITFFNNGKEFYSFSPTNFKLTDHNFYPCIYSDIYYNEVVYDDRVEYEDMIKKQISLYVNFGKTNVSYPQDDYKTPYGFYYKRTQFEAKLPIKAEIGGDKWKELVRSFSINCSGVKGTFDDKVPKIISSDMNIDVTSKNRFEMYSDSTIVNSTLYGSTAFVNLPIPKNQKIYLEFTCSRGELNDGIIGIPVSVGISNINNSILSKSSRMSLWHQKQAVYEYRLVEQLAETTHQCGDMETSVIPTQGKLVGVLIDLANNKLDFYIDKNKFYTYDLVLDFTDPYQLAYFFIHDDSIFTGSAVGLVNFGKTRFDMEPPKGAISLYSYYDRVYREISANYVKMIANIENDNNRAGYVSISATIDNAPNMVVPDTASLIGGYGSLYYLLNNFATLTDQEEHIIGDMALPAFKEEIKKNNYGFLPNIKNESYQLDFGETVVPTYTISIKQTKNQTIMCECGGKFYMETFDAKEGDIVLVHIKASTGYDAGTVHPYGRFRVTKNITISATPATVHRYSVTIINKPREKIYVEANGIGYTNTFNAVYGTKFRAYAIGETGYNPGEINIPEGVVTSDMTISTSMSTIKTFRVNIVQPEHYTLVVKYAGKEYTESFEVPYKSMITLVPTKVHKGYVINPEDRPVNYMMVEEDVTIAPKDAVEDVCNLTVVGAYNGNLTINGQRGSVFKFLKDDKVTIDFKVEDGYFIEEISIEPVQH